MNEQERIDAYIAEKKRQRALTEDELMKLADIAYPQGREAERHE